MMVWSAANKVDIHVISEETGCDGHTLLAKEDGWATVTYVIVWLRLVWVPLAHSIDYLVIVVSLLRRLVGGG